MGYWKLVSKVDGRARVLADRHYSRQSKGAIEFCPPGNSIVLLSWSNDALWVSHRPDPRAKLERPRKDGFEYWDNPYFRNESKHRASDMIREALAITLWIWGKDIPRDGFHSFVNPNKVKPTIRHGVPVYGWVFEKAGFSLHSEVTKERKLLRYIMTAERLRGIVPIEPESEQLRLFA